MSSEPKEPDYEQDSTEYTDWSKAEKTMFPNLKMSNPEPQTIEQRVMDILIWDTKHISVYEPGMVNLIVNAPIVAKKVSKLITEESTKAVVQELEALRSKFDGNNAGRKTEQIKHVEYSEVEFTGAEVASLITSRLTTLTSKEPS